MSRQIVVDTETTGLRVEDGHRVIEIGCVELIDRKLTGKHFHYYLNPNREIEAESLAVHGITNTFLQDKPNFNTIAEELIQFIEGSELIIHNAPFDLSFLDYEFSLIKPNWKTIKKICRVIDTLQLARNQYVGQRNSLDALCKRLKIDNSKRELHGALLDAHLLAQVYLVMTGGQGTFFEVLTEGQNNAIKHNDQTAPSRSKSYNLIVLKAKPDELSAHNEYLKLMQQKGKCIWLENSSLLETVE